MSHPRPARRRAGQTPALKAADCPCVADLIDYADGRASLEDRQRIEAHLQDTQCSYCQSWVAKAGAKSADTDNPGHFRSGAAIERRPATENTAWRREAFADLEQRLKQLEEGS